MHLTINFSRHVFHSSKSQISPGYAIIFATNKTPFISIDSRVKIYKDVYRKEFLTCGSSLCSKLLWKRSLCVLIRPHPFPSSEIHTGLASGQFSILPLVSRMASIFVWPQPLCRKFVVDFGAKVCAEPHKCLETLKRSLIWWRKRINSPSCDLLQKITTTFTSLNKTNGGHFEQK